MISHNFKRLVPFRIEPCPMMVRATLCGLRGSSQMVLFVGAPWPYRWRVHHHEKGFLRRHFPVRWVRALPKVELHIHLDPLLRNCRAGKIQPCVSEVRGTELSFVLGASWYTCLHGLLLDTLIPRYG